MTDKELNAIEIAAKAVPHGPLKKDMLGINNELGIYLAVASPDAILELIAELKQVTRERDWLAEHMPNRRCPNGKTSYTCNDWCHTAGGNVCYNCLLCWLKAAKEATCQKNT